MRLSPQIASSFQILKEMVEDWLAHSAYSVINLSKLFRFFTLSEKNKNKINSDTLEIDVLPETEHIDAMMEMGNY